MTTNNTNLLDLINELERLAETASREPWHLVTNVGMGEAWETIHSSDRRLMDMRDASQLGTDPDAELTVASRNAVPTLTAFARDVVKELEAARQALQLIENGSDFHTVHARATLTRLAEFLAKWGMAKEGE